MLVYRCVVKVRIMINAGFIFQLNFSSPTGCRMFQNFLFFVMSFIRFAWKKKTGRMKCHLVVSLYRPSHWCVPISSGKGQKWQFLPSIAKFLVGLFFIFWKCFYPQMCPPFSQTLLFQTKRKRNPPKHSTSFDFSSFQKSNHTPFPSKYVKKMDGKKKTTLRMTRPKIYRFFSDYSTYFVNQTFFPVAWMDTKRNIHKKY